MKKRLITAAFVFTLLTSCQKDFGDYVFSASAKPDHSTDNLTFKGPQTHMASGLARTWFSISKNGVPQEIGIEMSDKVFSALPDTNFSVALSFHNKATENTPFDHMYITWASHGHPLPGTFIGPHFDVRFFMTSLEDHLAIPAPPAAGFDNLPPAGYMPDNYYPDASVPKLGVHWTDKTFSNPVTNTMILGSYDGKFTFVSPIITLDVFKNGQNLSIPYTQPQKFARAGWYPTKYNVYVNTATQHHYVSLSAFVWRQ
jgi:hypothetical protein